MPEPSLQRRTMLRNVSSTQPVLRIFPADFSTCRTGDRHEETSWCTAWSRHSFHHHVVGGNASVRLGRLRQELPPQCVRYLCSRRSKSGLLPRHQGPQGDAYAGRDVSLHLTHSACDRAARSEATTRRRPPAAKSSSQRRKGRHDDEQVTPHLHGG